MDFWDGIIVAAAGTLIGTIAAAKILNLRPYGGGNPVQPAIGPTDQFGRTQPLLVYASPQNPAPTYASPVQQTNANQEAAFNQGPSTTFEPAFNTNFSNSYEVLPI